MNFIYTLLIFYKRKFNRHTICVTLSLPPGVRGWLRLLLVVFPGFFCLPLYKLDTIQQLIELLMLCS